MAEKQAQIPIREVFDHAEINRMEFEIWRLNRTPEDHTTDQEGIDFMKMLNRREKMKLLMNH